MNLIQLEAFVQVAESGSFSRAAKQLYLTQPTVSAHVASLEKELNTRLFIRNTREVNLSDDGRELYKYARQMADLKGQIEEKFGEREMVDRHYVTISASTIPAQYLLPGILQRFKEKYPNEQVKITESDSGKVVKQIASHMSDVGFTGTVLEKKDCKYLPIYKDELVIITPNTEKYQNLKEKGKDIFWVQSENLIMREPESGTRREAQRKMKESGIDLKRLRVVASMENQETIKKSVRREMGISMLSKLAVEDEVREGLLLMFPFPHGDSGRNINLVYNRNYQLSKSAQRFIKVVNELYKFDKDADINNITRG